MTTLQERLRDGADICYARNIQLDYARVVTEAADRIDALENEMARIRELWEADQIESSEQRTQIHQLRAQVETLTKDAARYHWLREHTMPKPLPMVRVQVMYQGQYILRDGPELDADVDNRIAAIGTRRLWAAWRDRAALQPNTQDPRTDTAFGGPKAREQMLNQLVHPAPQPNTQEPVAVVKYTTNQFKYIDWHAKHWTHVLDAGVKLYTHPAPQPNTQEAVAEVLWYDPMLYDPETNPYKRIDAPMSFMESAPLGTKLYTHPAPQQEPLTNDELWTVWDDYYSDTASYDRQSFDVAFLRAVLAAAHNIGVKP